MTRHDEAMRDGAALLRAAQEWDEMGGRDAGHDCEEAAERQAAYIADLEAAVALGVCPTCGGRERKVVMHTDLSTPLDPNLWPLDGCDPRGTTFGPCPDPYHDAREKVGL